jgi:hypothetical protein
VGTIIHACLAGQASVTQVNPEVCFLRLEPGDRTMTLGFFVDNVIQVKFDLSVIYVRLDRRQYPCGRNGYVVFLQAFLAAEEDVYICKHK